MPIYHCTHEDLIAGPPGCLFLDNRHRLLAFEELFRGTIDGASVHPREVVRQALLHNAASVIIAHNHPSGVVDPSQADEGVTRRGPAGPGAGGDPAARPPHCGRRAVLLVLGARAAVEAVVARLRAPTG